jgi:lipopolysaccharide/colanic/teichoic acid biosynthesis glycosyltransferase
MHPYAEYLQEYVYEQNNLKDGGKFKDDFRITSWGRFMRKFWIDELPMIINLLKGQIKLVGVRPLSEHYLSLYSDELKAKRANVKPGLVPPFYADLPISLQEIQESEIRYINAYQARGVRADFSYFMKAFNNIVFKSARTN